MRSAYGYSTSSVKHHSEIHIITSAIMKHCKGVNGDMKPEYNKAKTRQRYARPQTLKVKRQPSRTYCANLLELIAAISGPFCANLLELIAPSFWNLLCQPSGTYCAILLELIAPTFWNLLCQPSGTYCAYLLELIAPTFWNLLCQPSGTYCAYLQRCQWRYEVRI